MEYSIVIFIALLLLTNIKSLIRYCRTKKYLNKNLDIKFDNNKRDIVHVIIPVYNEVKNIRASVQYFKELYEMCNVYYVTTSKEKNFATYHEVKKNILQQHTNNIFLYNCPNSEGTMATQLNYMARQLPPNCIIAIYNIDSFPDKKTFKYILENLKSNEVYQQVSYFDNQCNGVLKSAQNWQNRWSLIYEMGKYLRESKYNNFIYTIGHGLFFNKEILDKYGYWNEKEINEDNELGYRLLCANIQIKTIPFLEKADFAKNIGIYVKQQSTWVNGPLYAFSYYKKNKPRTMRSFYLACLNFKAFISWTFLPIIALFFFIVSFFYNYLFSLIILLLIFSYVSIFNFLSKKLLINLRYINNAKVYINILADYIFFVIHSFGGFITLFKILLGKNTVKNKYNTEK